MAAAMDDRGLIVATDVRGRRVDLARANRPRVGRPVGAESFRPTPRRCHSPHPSTGSCSTCPARAWARSGAIRTSGGGVQRSRSSRPRRGPAADAGRDRARGSPGRPPRLLDLLERTRGKRGSGRGLLSRLAGSGRSPRDDLPAADAARSSTPAGHLRTFPFRDGLEASSAPCSCRDAGRRSDRANLRYNLRLHGLDDARVGRGQAAPPGRRAAPDLCRVRRGGDAGGA